MNKFLFLIFLTLVQCIYAAPMSFAADPVNYNFQPRQPITLANTISQTIQYACEMHVNVSFDNTLLIKQLKGSGVVNGTSLQKGRTLYLTIRQMQTMTIIASPGASMQFTNLGGYLIRGICY